MLKNVDIKDNAFIVMLGLITVNVFWGASSIAAKEALLQLNAIEIVALRFTIALLLVLGLALLFKKKNVFAIEARDVPTFILMSLANVSVGFILQVQALTCTTVTNFSLEFNLATFFIMLMGAAVLGERLTRKKVAGAAIAFAGAAIIITGGRLDFSSAHLLGDLMGIGSAISFGLFTIASKKVAGKYGLITILVYTFLFGIAELLPFYVLFTPMTPPTSLSVLSWSSILFLAVLCTVFAFFVYTHGLNRLRASDVAMSIYVTPLAGIILAIVLLGESMTAYTVGGTVFIMAGMYLARGELAVEKPERLPARNEGRTARGE
jgi:drug/metabolite transporter (DMT)-like permease